MQTYVPRIFCFTPLRSLPTQSSNGWSILPGRESSFLNKEGIFTSSSSTIRICLLKSMARAISYSRYLQSSAMEPLEAKARTRLHVGMTPLAVSIRSWTSPSRSLQKQVNPDRSNRGRSCLTRLQSPSISPQAKYMSIHSLLGKPRAIFGTFQVIFVSCLIRKIFPWKKLSSMKNNKMLWIKYQI